MNSKLLFPTIVLVVCTWFSCQGQIESKKGLETVEKGTTVKVEKPNRVSYSYQQKINGAVKDIMPLYCPVKEMEWCEYWSPQVVYSNSGLVEEDCIFIEPNDDTDIIWIVTEYNVEAGHVEMIYYEPGIAITKMEIQTQPTTKKTTSATVTYTKTSIGDKGDKVLKGLSQEKYNTMMMAWEKAMNYYLKTGKMLKGLPYF